MKIRRRPMPRLGEGNINVTPLIDVVMVLIVFFMLVAKIGVTTGAEPMDLPETILGSRLADLGNTLTLNVRDDERGQASVKALVDGEFLDLPVATGSLKAVLADLRQRNPEFKVIIRAPKDLPYRTLEPVLLACAQANVKNVNFNTEQVLVAQ